MLSKNIQSHAYKKLLEQQAQEDEATKARLADLRKKQIRDDIRRKREEEEARKREQQAKERKAQEARQAKLQAESNAKKQAEKVDAPQVGSVVKDKTVRPSKAPAPRTEASRPSKTLSSRYSDLLATAPTKLDTKSERAKTPSDIPTRQTIGRFAPSPLKKVELQKSLSADRFPSKAQSTIVDPRRTTTTTPKLPKGDTPERRASPLLNKKPSTAQKTKSASASVLSPQKKERDAKSQNTSTERGNGKPRSDGIKRPAKRPREEVDTGTESIWDILNPGKRKASYLARDIDSDDDDSGMEADIDSIRREEARAARAARLEDEKEAQLLKEAEERKRRRLKPL